MGEIAAAAAEHKKMLDASIYGVPPGQVVAISGGRQMGKTADIGRHMLAISGNTPNRPVKPPRKVLRQGAATSATIAGWCGADAQTRATWGPVTLIRIQPPNDPKWQSGDVLRCRRTNENMMVVHVSQNGVLFVTRGVGSVMAQVLEPGDVLDFIAVTGTNPFAGHGSQPPGTRSRPNYSSARHYGYGGVPTYPTPTTNHRPGLEEEIEEQLAIEPVVAWRTWKIATDDAWDVRLGSVSHSTLWPYQEELVADCSKHPSRVIANHKAPVLGCACGIYLTQSAQQSVAQVREMLYVLGVVRGWGRTIKHQTGWRVEKAYPVGLVVVSMQNGNEKARMRLAEKLQDAYAVPAISGPIAPKSAMAGQMDALAFAIKQGWVEKEGAPDAG